MCSDCGCSIGGKETVDRLDKTTASKAHQAAHETLHHNPQLNYAKTVSVIRKILDKNDHEADHIREHLERAGVLGINVMSSPGSGKTTLLEYLADIADFSFAVVEGDLETSRDADRLKAKGVEAVQIQTGSACHLDAFMVHKGLHSIDLDGLDVLFVENVGNLVCPASYDVGMHLNIVLVSVPEGNDKIAKYPVMFRSADLILITKTDLMPYFDYDIETEKQAARKINPSVDILEVNINDIDTLKAVAQWIGFKRKMR